jgi:hypothetical protein
MAEEHGQVVRVLEELGVTPNGKTINYVKKENASIRFIEFGSGGELPKILAGGFSSVHAARMAVNSYLKGLEPKPKKAAVKK